MQVAHAVSTHEVQIEVDYFTAVDDEQPKEETGAGHLGGFQFVSATFYKYFSLDWDGLVRNLDDDVELARQTVEAFIRAAALTTPTGKRNSFAHTNLPDAIIIEIKGEAVPTNYANAFVAPARPRTDRDGEHDIVSESVRMLAQYVREIDGSYGLAARRLVCITREKDRETDFGEAQPVASLSELAKATLAALVGQEEGVA